MDNRAEREYVACKCETSKEDFLIRLELHKGSWHAVKGYKIPKSQVGSWDTHEESHNFETSGGIAIAETFFCPYCGVKNFVVCASCKQNTCYDGGQFNTCAYCGSSGGIGGSATKFSLSGRDGV